MNWFTSDTHFGHNGIINYCNRPFSSVEEMNNELIRRWNVCVLPEDTVYHLGDFSFCGLIKTREILSQLNGKIVLIKGNHDKHFFRKNGELKNDLKFTNTQLSMEIEIQKTPIMLSHYQYKGYNDIEGRDFSQVQIDNKGFYLLHGHVHCGWKTKDHMINVGVDVWNYTPVSEQEIMELING